MLAVTPRLCLLILVLVTAASLGVAWWLWSPILGPYPFGPPPPPPPASRLTSAAARLYATTLPAIDVDRLAFADALDRLRDGAGAQIFVNWRALEASGINKDAPVSLHPPAANLGAVLRSLLDQIEVSHRGVRLDFTLDEGALVISTRDDLAKDVVVRVYDVRDLVDPDRLPTSSAAATPIFSRKVTAPSPPRHWTIDNLFRPGVRSGSPASRSAALVGEIQKAVDPTSWRGAGGKIGAVRALNGQLIVTQTPENQVQIIYFLQRCRWHEGVAVFAARTLTLLIPTLLLASLPSVLVFRRRRVRRRLAAGHCPTCDYDLRATPGRCPECGWGLSPAAGSVSPG
jgi:hypothetical protein